MTDSDTGDDITEEEKLFNSSVMAKAGIEKKTAFAPSGDSDDSEDSDEDLTEEERKFKSSVLEKTVGSHSLTKPAATHQEKKVSLAQRMKAKRDAAMMAKKEEREKNDKLREKATEAIKTRKKAAAEVKQTKRKETEVRASPKNSTATNVVVRTPISSGIGNIKFTKFKDLDSSSDESDDSDSDGAGFIDDVDLILKNIKIKDEKRMLEEQQEQERLQRVKLENERLERELNNKKGGAISTHSVKDQGMRDLQLLERIEQEVDIGVKAAASQEQAGFFSIFTGLFGLCSGNRDGDYGGDE
jgi:hypothetical protein